MIVRAYETVADDGTAFVEELAKRIEPSWWLVSTHTVTTLTGGGSEDVTGMLSDTTEGRAFGPDGEVRWRRDEGTMYTTVVTDRRNSLPESSSGDLALEPWGEPFEVDLWGELLGGIWSEPRFPFALDYRLAEHIDGAIVRLVIQRYLPVDGGSPIDSFAGVAIDHPSGTS